MKRAANKAPHVTPIRLSQRTSCRHELLAFGSHSSSQRSNQARGKQCRAFFIGPSCPWTDRQTLMTTEKSYTSTEPSGLLYKALSPRKCIMRKGAKSWLWSYVVHSVSWSSYDWLLTSYDPQEPRYDNERKVKDLVKWLPP
jgi:hypothetical protein